jgi:hypothetical protein
MVMAWVDVGGLKDLSGGGLRRFDACCVLRSTSNDSDYRLAYYGMKHGNYQN